MCWSLESGAQAWVQFNLDIYCESSVANNYASCPAGILEGHTSKHLMFGEIFGSHGKHTLSRALTVRKEFDTRNNDCPEI